MKLLKKLRIFLKNSEINNCRTFALSCVFSLLIVFQGFSAPRSEQELVLSGSWVYDALTAIALESGIVQFTDSAPLSIAEIKTYLYEIDYDALSGAGRNQYDRISEYFSHNNLSFDSGIYSIGIDPSINPEGYYKSNDDIDWVYDRYNRNQFFDIPLTFSVGNYVSMYMDLYLGENQCAMSHDDNYENLPLSADDIDINFPHVTYGSTGYKFTDTCGLRFTLGMGPSSIGRTETGSIVYSDYMTQASYGQLSLYSQNFKYTMLVTQLNVDKNMYTHRLDFRFFKKLTITALESTLTNAPMELRYLNPLTVYHGATPWRDYDSDDSHNCEFLGVSIQYTPVKNVRLYGLFAMNQFQTAYENSNFDSRTPNSMGGQAGLESYIPSHDGYIHFGIEGYYANPYLYIKQSPDWSLCRTYEENIGDKDSFYEWTGSPFGPDTIAGNLTIGYEKPSEWSVDVTYLYLCQGENACDNVFKNLGWGGTDTIFDMADTDKWAYPTDSNGLNQYAVTPTGTPQYTHKVSVRGTWYATEKLSFTLQPAYVIIFNNNNDRGVTDWGVESVLAVKYSFLK